MPKGRRAKKYIISAVLLSIALLLVSCGDQSTFDAKGEVAEKQLTLFWIIFGLGAFVFVVVEGALLYSAFRYRRRPGEGIPTQTHGHTKLEIAWTIAPALVLVAIAIPTLIVIFQTSTNASTDLPIEQVDVTANQWWWEFRYPEYDVTTANELVVPVGTRINLRLQSDDVIHSFWIPNLMGKLDLIPRNVNETWFVANEPGIYKGQCAEFCGTAHAQMRFRVIVRTREDFDGWLKAYSRSPVEPSGEAALGKQLFEGKGGCTLCHSKDGPGSPALREQLRKTFLDGGPAVPGPNLTMFATRGTMAAGILPLTESNLTAWIRNPEDVKPGNRMAERAAVYNDPALALTDEEVESLVDYLLTLRPAVEVVPTPTPIPPSGATPTPTSLPLEPTPEPTIPAPSSIDLPPGNASAGEQVFTTALPLSCSTCHSLDGAPGIGPSLRGIAARAGARVPGLSPEAYITQSVLEPNAFVVDGFPSGVMPQNFGETLSPQQISDVIAFLLTLE